MLFEHRLDEAAALVEAHLAAVLDGERLRRTPPRLKAAMRHALLGGGKRFRPCLILAAARLFGVAPPAALNAAAAVEAVHCYSLVHDDLPAMDNDELRRGRPTVWKAFDVPTAILAGDALLTLAFELMADEATHAQADVRAELALGLARASGAAGMAGGQQLDMEAEEPGRGDLHAIDGVEMIQTMKTGALIRFSAEAGAILAGSPAAERGALTVYGNALGAAFQIADDLIDARGDSSKAGKSLRKDAAARKATWISVRGIAAAEAKLAQLEAEALAALGRFGTSADVLRGAIRFVIERAL
jgi:farnesyl diphosphate synthase